MLKPLPQENPVKTTQKKHSKQLPKINFRIGKIETMDQKILQFSLMKLMSYLKKAEAYGIKEMGDIIHHLHRTVLTLERARMKLIQKEQRKKRKN